MTTPAAYLRKSKDAATKSDHLALLMASVRAHGHNGDTVVYDDWARSGDIEKIAARTEWKRLCDAIERGAHDVVFMNSLDRGGRSIEEWLRFVRLARSRNVRVIADGVDYSSSENRDRLIFEAWAAEKELERAKERSARTVRIRESRGDVTTGGHGAPYGQMWQRDHTSPCPAASPERCRCRIVVVDNPDEPVQPLLDAIKATKGNVLQAARRLNDLGIPTRSGRPWDPRVLTRALDRLGAIRVRRGSSANGRRRAPSDAPLSRLVECHCGATMTPERDRRNGQWLGLVCASGRKVGLAAHGRTVARSRHVIERLKDDLRISRITIERAAPSDTSAKRAKLNDERRRLPIYLDDGAITDAEYRSRMDAVKRDLAALDDDVAADSEWVGVSPLTPLVDWTADDVTIGDQLRKVVRVVRLNESMVPADVEYRVRLNRRAKQTA